MDVSQIIGADLEREIRSLTGKLATLTATARPLFERVAVVRAVFTDLAEPYPVDVVADVAAESGLHALLDALDNFAELFETVFGAANP